MTGLPDPIVPFAVRSAGTVRPDLFRLDAPPPIEDHGPRTVVRLDREVPDLVAAKVVALGAAAHRWTSVAPDALPARLAAAGGRSAARVAAVCPRLLQVRSGTVVLPGVGLGVTAIGAVVEVPRDPEAAVVSDREAMRARLLAVPEHLRSLEAVALAVAEDLVLVDVEGRALWVHVCAPSGWDPGSAGGRPLAGLHGPIPTGDRLRRASRNLAAAIAHGGPFVRWTWGLSADDELAHHALDRRSTPTAPPDRLTFRAERQTTWPLDGLDAGMFAIRVHLAPLRQVIDSAARAAQLLDAVCSLPDDLAAYKGIDQLGRERLVRWLVPRTREPTDGPTSTPPAEQ